EKVITRLHGSGTTVSLDYGPRNGNMEIITIVAPAQNFFFSQMIDAVQTKADALDALVLFQQKPKDIPLEKCLFRIYRKGLRNLILWKEDMELQSEYLDRLKGLGMSIVLFDSNSDSGLIDSVSLDNANAVCQLSEAMSPDSDSCAFVTWDHPGISSLQIREKTFQTLFPHGTVLRIPYQYHNRESTLEPQMLTETLKKLSSFSSVIYAVGELGILFEGASHASGIRHKAGMIGMMQGARELGITVVEQDFTGMADRIIQCLKIQNIEHSGWIPTDYPIPGKLL
ncbi:MAG: hypothetical protein IJ091_03555, partial [Oscillospiraceae bacterium]|nr:hypothetical protein [Oscillospiraceae bacterium]